MEAILKFNLPDEKEEFDFATNGQNYYNTLFSLNEELRSRLKYGDLDPEVKEELEHIKWFLTQNLTERGLVL